MEHQLPAVNFLAMGDMGVQVSATSPGHFAVYAVQAVDY
jgi:hypothetical protein